MEDQEVHFEKLKFLKYLNILLKHKVFICTIIGIIVVGTAVTTLFLTPLYEARAVITPATKNAEPTAGFGGLMAQFGVGAPATAAMSELMNLLNSDILKENTVRRHNLSVVLFKKGLPAKTSEEVKIWAGIRRLKSILRITANQKEHAIRLSATFEDPNVAADILRYTLAELTERMSSEARRVAETNKEYLEKEVEKTADPFIRTKIYSLIAQQIETSMMAEVKENFAFKIIDPPRAPDRKIKPQRLRIVLISFIISIFVAAGAALGKEHFYARSNGKAAMDC